MNVSHNRSETFISKVDVRYDRSYYTKVDHSLSQREKYKRMEQRFSMV